MTLTERVRVRLNNEPGMENEILLTELCDLAVTRICLRIKTEKLPEIFIPIAADIVVKIWRRYTYEGISSEGADKITTTFFEDILAEYDHEFSAWLDNQEEETGRRKICFI